MKTPDRVNDVIVRLKSENPQAKLDEQLYAIPRRADKLIKRQVDCYYASDRKRTLFNTGTRVCLELEPKYFPMIARNFIKLQDSDTPVIDLIEHQLLYPFMLFINGFFIPWECINLIGSYGKYYFFIKNLTKEFITGIRAAVRMNLIILPTHITYAMGGEEARFMVPTFRFNEKGLYSATNWTHCIYFPEGDKLQIAVKNDVTNGTIYQYNQASEDARYKIFDENFFWFDQETGMFIDNVYVTSYGNFIKPTFSDDAPEKAVYKFVYIANIKDRTPVIDNIALPLYPRIQDDVKQAVRSFTDASFYSQMLVDPFDLKMSRQKKYFQNRAEAIDYILRYRPDLFQELYEFELDFFCLPVDFEWLNEHLDEEGYLNIPRRSQNKLDYNVILFVNGCLYQYYKHHFYRADRFICPVTNIGGFDKIELMFFKNAEVYSFTTVINKNEPFYPLEPYFYNENTRIFCKETEDKYFQFPRHGDQHFQVPFTLEQDARGYKRITFQSEFFYGKQVDIVPDTQFKYFGFVVDTEEEKYIKLNMAEWFHGCWDYNRYMVFQNGRRLNNDQYRLTVPCRTTTPFYRFDIYLATPLTYMDRLDVFYLPGEFKDLDMELPMDGNGLVHFNSRADLPYLLGNSLYVLWVNGKKVPLQDIANIDSSTLQITANQRSKKNLRITRMGSGNEEIEKHRLTVEESLWDRILQANSDPANLLGIYSEPFYDNEADAYKGAVPIVSVMLELIREHYLANALVDTTGPFLYDYLDQDQSILMDDKDQGGNTIIDAANANESNNLDIERYYP